MTSNETLSDTQELAPGYDQREKKKPTKYEGLMKLKDFIAEFIKAGDTQRAIPFDTMEEALVSARAFNLKWVERFELDFTDGNAVENLIPRLHAQGEGVQVPNVMLHQPQYEHDEDDDEEDDEDDDRHHEIFEVRTSKKNPSRALNPGEVAEGVIDGITIVPQLNEKTGSYHTPAYITLRLDDGVDYTVIPPEYPFPLVKVKVTKRAAIEMSSRSQIDIPELDDLEAQRSIAQTLASKGLQKSVFKSGVNNIIAALHGAGLNNFEDMRHMDRINKIGPRSVELINGGLFTEDKMSDFLMTVFGRMRSVMIGETHCRLKDIYFTYDDEGEKAVRAFMAMEVDRGDGKNTDIRSYAIDDLSEFRF